jgi:hypothetical protein
MKKIMPDKESKTINPNLDGQSKAVFTKNTTATLIEKQN